MLTQEAAEKILKQWHFDPSAEYDYQDRTPKSRFVDQYRKLPKKLRTIALGLYRLDEEGKPIKFNLTYREDNTPVRNAIAYYFQEFFQLSTKDRLKILSIPLPKLAATAVRTLQWMETSAHPSHYGFRAPKLKQRQKPEFQEMLATLLKLAEVYQDEVISAPWLAVWSPYLRFGWQPLESSMVPLLTIAIESGDAEGDEVLDILLQCGRNEHPQGCMGRHVTGALLAANRPDAWEFVEKLLLAAQRQEGLRQAILDELPYAHPQAFVKILKAIIEHDLVRFSAVTHALNSWLNYAWDSQSTKVINQTLEKCTIYLADEATRLQAAAGGDAESAYLALWAISIYDAEAAIEPIQKLLASDQVELRYAAVRHLIRLDFSPQTQELVLSTLYDKDLRIATLAMHAIQTCEKFTDEQYAAVEQLFLRLPVKPETTDPLVWPWTAMTIQQSQAAYVLLSNLDNRPISVIAPYLPSLDSWGRERVLRVLAERKDWSPENRTFAIELAGDISASARSAAFKVLQHFSLTEADCLQLEGYLARKAADLRSGVLELLAKTKDPLALASAQRLLQQKSAPQRVAGLELLRTLKENNRAAETCQELAAEFRQARKKITKEEETHLGIIEQQTSNQEQLTFDNGLGFFDPAKLTPGTPPQARKVKFRTSAAEKVLVDLDKLIHTHRELPINTYGGAVPLGAARWIRSPYHYHSRKKQLAELSFREILTDWLEQRPASLRDADGLELQRVTDALYQIDRSEKIRPYHFFKKNPEWQEIQKLISFDFPKLKYPVQVQKFLEWALYMQSPANLVDYYLDCFETLCALVPRADQQKLPSAAATEQSDADSSFDEEQEPGVLLADIATQCASSSKDWRTSPPIERWHDLLSRAYRLQSKTITPEQHTRFWQLLSWFDRPVPDAKRKRVPTPILVWAYRNGQATLDDLADHLIGPRPARESYYSYGSEFSDLGYWSQRVLAKDDTEFLQEFPEVHELIDRIRNKILDIELTRGDTATVVTPAALSLRSLIGTDSLQRVLTALGKTPFKVVTDRYSTTDHFASTLTHLAQITYPAEDDTPEKFAKQMKQAVKNKEFPEDRLIELAFLAPQWVNHIEAYFGYSGLAEAVYWFLAHMSFLWGSDIGEKAATAAGIEEPREATADRLEQDDSDDPLNDTAEETEENSTPAQPKLSPWQRLIVQRTPLTENERELGAIDTAWFHRVYKALGAKRWQQLSKGARYASTPAQSKKAQLIADVLLGTADLAGLIAGIEQRQLKDNVRLIGLYPLPSGARRDAELKRRFNILQDYHRYAKKLSGLTKPQAMIALEVGLRNLATVAGYADPLRLEWALGAEELKDLAKGPVSVTQDGVTVTLAIDENSQPVMSIARGEKPLKSAPAAVKKSPAVAELFERNRDLRRKASRMKAALEQCMCRGETFSSQELKTLMGHPLVAPLLQRLVLVGDGILGYPDHQGKALRDFSGHLEPVKKSEQLRIAHPYDLYQAKNWDRWQRDCFQAERVQPFKQIFRELYLPTKQELADGKASSRYAGQQVNPFQAMALWGTRGWNTGDGVFKVFHELQLTAMVDFNYGFTTPLEVEGLTLDTIFFTQTKNLWPEPLALKDVPPRVFSEVMRDCDLVVSVAHRGGVDPEASASTVEMRASLVQETAQLLGLKNIKVKNNFIFIEGSLSQYSIHLGSGTVHRLPGGSLCIVPVHAQHRGRIFLPFADDDPRTAEVLSKVLLLARDQEIQDPSILEQLRA